MIANVATLKNWKKKPKKPWINWTILNLKSVIIMILKSDLKNKINYSFSQCGS